MRAQLDGRRADPFAMKLLARRPWLLIVAAFLALIAAWTAFIVVAEHHKPVEIPVPKPARP